MVPYINGTVHDTLEHSFLVTYSQIVILRHLGNTKQCHIWAGKIFSPCNILFKLVQKTIFIKSELQITLRNFSIWKRCMILGTVKSIIKESDGTIRYFEMLPLPDYGMVLKVCSPTSINPYAAGG